MERKQTAVGWLVEQLPIRMKNYLAEEIETARQMEKEQTINSWLDGLTGNELQKLAAEKYFDETYDITK